MKRAVRLIAVSTLSIVLAASVEAVAGAASTALITSLVTAAPPQALNPPYLSEMPTVDRVMQAMRTSDPRETALRQMGAFYQLIEIIKTLSGRREFRGFTPDEGRIIGAYQVAQYDVGQAADKSFPGPAGGSAKFSDQTPYRYGRWDPRFGMEGIQTFTTFFPPTLKAEFDKIVGGDNARRQARQDADPIRVKPPAANNGQTAVPSGVDGLVQALSDLINQSGAQQPSAQVTNAPSGPAAQMATAESKQGQAFLKAKDYGRAAEHFNKSIAIAPSSAAYTGLGSAYYGLKQYPKAIEAYKQAIQMAPNVAEVHLWLARAYNDHGVTLVTGPSASKDFKPFANAEAEAREALRLKPDYHDAYFMLGNATLVQRRYPEALTAFQQAIRLKPDDEASLYLLSLSYAKLGKKDEAMQVYQRLATLNKEYAQGLLAEINRPIAASPPATAAPGTAGYFLNEGQKYHTAKEYAKAVESLQKAITLKPDVTTLAQTQAWLGSSFRELKQYPNAIAALKESLRLRPNDANTTFGLGWTYYLAGQHQNALATLQEGARLDPKDAETQYWIGEVYLVGLNESEKAIPAFRESLRLRPSDARTSGELGAAYHRLKQYPSAVAAFQQAIRIKPDYTDAYRGLALTYLSMDKEDEARKVSQALRRIDKKKADELDLEIMADEIVRLVDGPPANTGGNPATRPSSGGRPSQPVQGAQPIQAAPGISSGPPSGRTGSGADADLAQGHKYFKAKDGAKALEAYQQAVRLKPDNAEGHFWIGETYLKLGQPDKAVAAFRESLRVRPNDARTFGELGTAYHALRQYSEAAAAFQQAVRLEPNESVNYWWLGLVYDNSLQFEKAAAAYKEVVRLKPDDKAALQDLGRDYAILGKKAEAMQVYNALLKLDKDAAKSFLDEINGAGGAANVLVQKAQVELMGHNKETALEYLRYALRLKPADPDALLEIGTTFGYAERYDEALELYRRVIAMKPKPEGLAEAHRSIGSTHNDMKEYAKALPELKEAQRIKPDYYTSKLLGTAYFELKDYPNALAAFQDSVRLKPDYADGHFWIGKTFVVIKQPDKALAAFQEFVRLEPKDSKGSYELGHTYFVLRRFPEAVSALEKAISISPKNTEAQLGLGMSYLAMGRREAALQVHNTLQTLDKAMAQQLYNAINRPGTGPPPERRGPGKNVPLGRR